MAFLSCLFVALLVGAQEDIRIRPTGTTAAWAADANPEGLQPVRGCLFLVGTDYLDPANHLFCADVAADLSVQGTTTTPFGTGDQTYRAVAVSPTGAISEPSVDTLTIEDIPLPLVLRRPAP